KAAVSGFAGNLNRCVERDQGLSEVARIGCDALIGGSEHRMAAIKAFQGSTAGSGIALVAGVVTDVAEIAAPRPLQDIPAERRHVAQLRARSKLEGIGNDRIVLRN